MHCLTRLIKPTTVVIAAIAAWGFQSPTRRPLSFALACAGADCPLLEGAPQSAGMRGGFVRLPPGESVGWHSYRLRMRNRWSSCTARAKRFSTEVMAKIDSDTTLLVLSDYGLAPYRHSFNLNTWLLNNGYITRKPGARADSRTLHRRGLDPYPRLRIGTERTVFEYSRP